ncbi:hypothetical protein [Paenibacillus apiarius]|uniref:Uncharacterized protein n=1 Tax=Paenibacillus apiarius TaxID=46240 RepID=A0ABT4DNP3_9BACL|nr:hypothetical protein [Paenibacillus apiarius]MBN3525279.1 hypothetical protein [Paenibacillus apiarius]MCY9512998.1 hypothetical protein [Paenibacillus apiarius]MCY9518982.1 hypothetical protein [Paenibacillus apiarius]MCY9550791.1 hypothetical protein [Paenibacillus apiarius]MCY9559775.1 hypothetical protein [Paenibacillus apiarius]
MLRIASRLLFSVYYAKKDAALDGCVMLARNPVKIDYDPNWDEGIR